MDHSEINGYNVYVLVAVMIYASSMFNRAVASTYYNVTYPIFSFNLTSSRDYVADPLKINTFFYQTYPIHKVQFTTSSTQLGPVLIDEQNYVFCYFMYCYYIANNNG